MISKEEENRLKQEEEESQVARKIKKARLKEQEAVCGGRVGLSLVLLL